VVTRAVQGLDDLNALTGIDDGKPHVSQVIEWLARQGRSESWLHELFDVLDASPYAGDTMDLALSLGGQDVFTMRSLLHDGAAFIGIDRLNPGVDIVRVTGTGGRGLPDFVAIIDNQTLVANVPAGVDWLDLRITARTAEGETVSWIVTVNLRSAELMPGGQRDAALPAPALHFADQLKALGTDEQLAARSLITALSG
jgi:hypothetical protein